MPQPAWKFAFLSALMTMSADVSMAARPAPVKEVSRQVEVVVGGRLRETTKGQGELSISLWNKSDVAIAGPIFVVVDETGLADVKVGSHTTETANGKPLFELVPVNKELLPGGMTKSYPLAFSMPAGLSRDAANELHLATRVFGRQGSPDAQKVAREQEAREDADFATRGKNYTQAELDHAIESQRKLTQQLANTPDVFATGITEDAKGNLSVRVYTETRAAARALPGSFEGLPVEGTPVPGGFKGGLPSNTLSSAGGKVTSRATRDRQAAAAQGDSATAARGKTSPAPNATNAGDKPFVVTPVNPQQRFDRPVPIGVSSFNSDVPCNAGTLGARVKDPSGKLYAISNSHVWGEMGFASVGQNVVQPGTLDNFCVIVPDDIVGVVAGFTAFQNTNPPSGFFQPGLSLNFIDAALMEVVDSTDPAGNVVPGVGFATPSDGYGAPSSRILRQNRLGLQVQKYGRTTGYTRGFTSATSIQATIAGATQVDNTEFFRIDEFLGLDPYPSLGAPGDSGSLIVTLEDRRPVALLFAGGSLGGLNRVRTLGNPIGPVLDWFNVQIDDGRDAGVHTGGVGNIGMLGRGGLALGNLDQKDLTDFVIVDNTGIIISELLPPELRDRVPGNRRPLIPVNNGSGFP